MLVGMYTIKICRLSKRKKDYCMTIIRDYFTNRFTYPRPSLPFRVHAIVQQLLPQRALRLHRPGSPGSQPGP